jgi:hypothetical protein
MRGAQECNTVSNQLGRWAHGLTSKKKRGVSEKWRGQALLALQDGYAADDVLTALLQVAHLRRVPFRRDLSASQARQWALEESLWRAVKDFPRFKAALDTQGWQSKQVLLSSAEQVTFKVEGGLDALSKQLAARR